MIFSFLALVACRSTSDLPGPDDGEEQTVSIAYLKTLYRGASTLIDSEIRIEGAVISSDDQGNFYHTLLVDDGTGGIEVKLAMDQIFKQFRVHSHVTVRCNGLWLGSYGGTLQLGAQPFGEYEVEPLGQAQAAEHLSCDNEFCGEVLPTILTFSELSLQHISTFVAFEGVSFVEQGQQWAETEALTNPEIATHSATGAATPAARAPNHVLATDPATEPPSATNRHIIDRQGNTLIVRTSRYARFATWLLPAGEGRIEGVLGYFSGDYQLVVLDAMKFQPTRQPGN